MKKIWPWLLLLLLLIIICVWTKKDSIHLSSDSDTQTIATPVVATEKNNINYTIAQTGEAYTLNGDFTDTVQQASLGDTFTVAQSSLAIKNTTTSASLVDDGAIRLTNKILPHFIKNYKNGKIVYTDKTLKVYGDTDNYEVQHEMQRLLNSSKLPSQDHSKVIEKKPIHFTITKNNEKIDASGIFNDKQQSAALHSQLPVTTTSRFTHEAHRVDNGALVATEKILPSFMKKYTQGKIEYVNEILTVSGMVTSQVELDTMNNLLSNVGIAVVNNTTVDSVALAKAKADEDAKRAETERLAALAKADEDAKRAEAERLATLAKADEDAKRAEAERLATLAKADEDAKRAEAERKAREEKARLAAKERIARLLQIENIEFKTSKGTLTTRGATTVNKLANILNEYPDIKIEIAGHTDSDGSSKFNQKLSQSRVNTVRSTLISKGISATRLTAIGYGESKPLVPNTTRENKQRNRRVEINIKKGE